jgi:hypothetical protein
MDENKNVDWSSASAWSLLILLIVFGFGKFPEKDQEEPKN